MVYVSGSWLCSMNSTWPQDPEGDPEDLRPLVWWCSDSMLHWIRRECSGCCNGCGSRPGHKLDQSRLLAKHSWCLDVFNMFSWFVLCCLLALCILMLVAVLAMPVWCTLELRKQWYQNIVRAVTGHMMMSYWAELLCALCMPMWNGCLLHVLPLGLDLLYVNWEMTSRRSLPAKVAKSKKETCAPVLWGCYLYNGAHSDDVILLHQCVLVAGPGVELRHYYLWFTECSITMNKDGTSWYLWAPLLLRLFIVQAWPHVFEMISSDISNFHAD